MRQTVLVLLAGVLWSFSGVLIKAIHWDFFSITAVRSLIGGALQFAFLCFFLLADRHAKNGADALQLALRGLFARDAAHWIGACLFVMNMLALAWAFQVSNATNAVFLHYSGLVLVAVLSYPVLKQKVTRHDWIALIGSTLGIFYLSSDGMQLGARLGTILGIICGLTLAGCQLCLGIRTQERGSHKNALQTVILANVITAALGLPLILLQILVHQQSLPPPGDWLLLLILGIVPWGLPDVMYVIAIEKVPIFRALILGLSDPVLTAMWPALFLHEYPSVAAVMGSLAVIISIVYQAAQSARAPALARAELLQ